jgi:hypothetical protein
MAINLQQSIINFLNFHTASTTPNQNFLKMKSLKHCLLTASLKIFIAFTIIASLCFFTVAMKAIKIADDVWKQLGLTSVDGNININVSVGSGALQYAGAKNAKNIAVGDRAGVINQLVAYAKKYTAGAEFKNDYKRRWEAYKNDWVRRNYKPEPVTVTAESIKAEEKQRLEQQLKAAEQNLNSPNPKIKNGAPYAIENTKKQIAALEDPNNPVIKRRLDEANRMATASQKQYDESKQKFEAEHPEDPQVLIKKRLQQILDVTADVDYAAELKEGYKGKKVFVNPVYEKKPAEWKLAFRAGKAATDAVRAAAQQWLKELNAAPKRS